MAKRRRSFVKTLEKVEKRMQFTRELIEDQYRALTVQGYSELIMTGYQQNVAAVREAKELIKRAHELRRKRRYTDAINLLEKAYYILS